MPFAAMAGDIGSGTAPSLLIRNQTAATEVPLREQSASIVDGPSHFCEGCFGGLFSFGASKKPVVHYEPNTEIGRLRDLVTEQAKIIEEMAPRLAELARMRVDHIEKASVPEMTSPYTGRPMNLGSEARNIRNRFTIGTPSHSVTSRSRMSAQGDSDIESVTQQLDNLAKMSDVMEDSTVMTLGEFRSRLKMKKAQQKAMRGNPNDHISSWQNQHQAGKGAGNGIGPSFLTKKNSLIDFDNTNRLLGDEYKFTPMHSPGPGMFNRPQMYG